MTDEQINIKIAKARGYVDLEKLWEGYHKWRHPNGHVIFGSKSNKYSCLPNYCNDLNACHELAAWLDTEQQIQFAEELWFLVSENPYRVWWNLNANEAYQLAEATARQRAEAFLRIMNLWEE